MITTRDLTNRLVALGEDYTYRVNLLLDEGREDLAAKVADEYSRDVSRLLADG